MALIKTLTAAAVAATIAGSAIAGGFATEIVEPPVVIVEPEAPRGSLPGWVIPAVIVAALIGVASQEDDSDTAGVVTPEE